MRRDKTRNTGMKVESVRLEALEANNDNPRVMDEVAMGKLCDSISKFGAKVPIIVNRLDGGRMRIVGGHQRVTAMRRLGMEECPAVVLELDAERERELLLRLNRNTGRWDWDKLAEFEPEELLEAGFTEPELAANGAGGMGAEVESAEGGKAMTVRLAFRTEAEHMDAMTHFNGHDNVERTRSLLSAIREGNLAI